MEHTLSKTDKSLLRKYLERCLLLKDEYLQLTSSQSIIVLRCILEPQSTSYLDVNAQNNNDHFRNDKDNGEDDEQCAEKFFLTQELLRSIKILRDILNVSKDSDMGSHRNENEHLLDSLMNNVCERTDTRKMDMVRYISQVLADEMAQKMIIRKKEELLEERRQQETVDDYWSIISPAASAKANSMSNDYSQMGNKYASEKSTNKARKAFSPVPKSFKSSISTQNGIIFPPIPQQLLNKKFIPVPPPVVKTKLTNVRKIWDKPCILIVGNSGAGKSSLINTIFGTEVSVGVGKPVTQEIHIIEHKSLILVDSKGLEIESQGYYAMSKLSSFLSSRTFNTKVHMVWYVIASDSARVEQGIKEVCQKFFPDIPIFFILTKCDKISPKNLQIMRKAVESLKIKETSGIFAVSDRPPVLLNYPRLCPYCPDTNIEPLFQRDSIPQMIYCKCCKSYSSACKFCDNAKLVFDTVEQNWICKACKNEWEQLTTAENELEELIVSTYHRFTLISEEHAILFQKSLLARHLKLLASGMAGAFGVGLTGALLGASVGGVVGAGLGGVVGVVGGTIAGVGAASSMISDPCDTKKKTSTTEETY
jgi:GTP-binding protein EngB required for normal cell division